MHSFSSVKFGGLLLLALGGAAGTARAQAPAWQSVVATTAIAGTGAEVNASTTDAAGNVLLVGEFNGTIQLGATTLTSAGGDNAFVAKWSPTSRSFVWALRLGGTGNDYGQALAVSGSNVYVGGFFSSPTLAVGSTILTNTSTPNNNSSDGFVVKIIDAGASASFGWAQRLGGAASEGINGLAAVGSSVYVAASFGSATAQLGSSTFSNAGGSDVLVAKLTDAGASSSVAWAQQAGGPGFDQAAALAVSGSSVYVVGGFGQTVSFGNTVLVNSTGGPGEPNLFVAKLADAGTTGSFAWATKGVANSVFARGVAASGSSVYVAGDFSGATATFGGATLTNAGGSTGNDAFVAKLTDAGTTGTFDWAQAAGGPDYDGATAVAVRGSSVYVTGHFSSATVPFGSTTLTNPNPGTSYDVFVARLRDAGPSGSFVWAASGGSFTSDYARAVALGGTTVYVAGSMHTPATFGSQVVGTGPVSGGSVAFVASLADATGLATAAATALPGLRLVPNPAHGRVTVQLPALPGTATANISVLDALGRAVHTQAATPNASAELDLTGLAPGLYAVRVQAGVATATQRLLVE